MDGWIRVLHHFSSWNQASKRWEAQTAMQWGIFFFYETLLSNINETLKWWFLVLIVYADTSWEAHAWELRITAGHRGWLLYSDSYKHTFIHSGLLHVHVSKPVGLQGREISIFFSKMLVSLCNYHVLYYKIDAHLDIWSRNHRHIGIA